MTKEQLLKRSRELGKDISSLINEFRNSSGENVDHCEEYYKEFFAGVIAFMCTSGGVVTIEYENDPDYTMIDGEVTCDVEVHYPYDSSFIHDHYHVQEQKFVDHGEIKYAYNLTMDPITYLDYIMTSPIKGKALPREVGDFEGV
jgi:hypothetical protein